jgi:glutaconyl-CoA/methylmalonyl-CoA decarboxylase subunit gamma
MKSYKIHINGKSYDVKVEELDAAQAQGAPAGAAGASTAAGTRKSAPAAAPAAGPAAQARSGEVQVKSSMPGTVRGFKAQVGRSVKAGEVLLILEAMKMENEIVSPVEGVLKSFAVKEGASVSAGDLLATIA